VIAVIVNSLAIVFADLTGILVVCAAAAMARDARQMSRFRRVERGVNLPMRCSAWWASHHFPFVPQKRGPGAEPPNWIAAFAGTNGVCGCVPRKACAVGPVL
jgi:hypothetical protein